VSVVADLLAAGPGSPPFDIVRAASTELHVTDLAEARRFYVDLLGLVVSSESDDVLYLRGWEERLHHSLVLRRASVPAAAAVAFRLRSEGDLEPLARYFEDLGCVVRRTAGGEGRGTRVRVWDPFGFPLEFFHESALFETQLQRFDLHRGAPIMRFDHVNLHSPQVEEGVRFWMQLGFRCSEYISTDGDDERLTGAWLLRKPTVHDVAFTAGRGPRLHHVGLAVAEPAAVLRACDQLAAAGYASAIERGPGRHGVSNAFFVYLRDPDGHRIELYACDYYTGDPDLVPIRWSVSDARCRSFWGARAPDSWYEDSTVVLDPDGLPTTTVEASVDERRVRSDVLS